MARLTSDELRQAREWIADCEWREDFSADDIAELTPAEVARGIQANYDGGLAAFKRDCNPVPTMED